MVERVSSHFRYTEEYVINHTFHWLKRKCEQANREQYEHRQMTSEETMRGVLAAISGMFGESHPEKMLLPDYEDNRTQEEDTGDWVTGQWWKPKAG
ncbi:hypothetical protein NOM01_11000 [Sporolactobacillus sp. STSJ-5]|uniref:hypothetical protein n=1 Tax=Sporolactobacillus sp. STSJ-5 TaxID=2965076 RepID=UPI002107B03C|nr:hypothetical protein [Sporolactobacillus sp. STSJ-5]MCQ2010543.1 hypothetical protein [Sporolactobacillus sp. STSJ-5]